MKFITLLSALFIAFSLSAQVVSSNPTFPKINDKVTITFDASKGTAGLKDCNCDIYLHTGVITSESTSGSDWKHVVTSWGVANQAWKMTKVQGQANLYIFTISPDIKTYYGINTGETVKKMAFVFRNADGSKEGKADGGKDIFIDVYPDDAGLIVTLNSPSQSEIIVGKNDTIPIKVTASERVYFDIYEDNLPVYHNLGEKLDYNLIAGETGTHFVEIKANTTSKSKIVSFHYTVPDTNLIKDLPAGIEDGITIIDSNTVVFTLFAPGKKHVFLTGDFNDWKINAEYQLANTPDGNRWWIEISGLETGKQYAFQYLVDGSIKIGDPYSEIVLDPWNDKYIPDNVFPGLKPYPNDKTSGIVSVFSTEKENFDWENDDFEKPAKEKLIIYEILMRDFLKDHSFGSLTDTLDYLERLGINAIELMPVNEFEGNNSWGYNPSYHYALDKYYGNPESFKRFVDEAHSRNIAVILDVVYNHAFSQCPLVQLYWDDTNFRPSQDSPWFNQVPKHPFNVGYDFNHESNATKYYVKRGLKHWMDEYHIDGFRFDLSKGFTQKQSYNNTQMSAYDGSRIAILKDYADYIWSFDSTEYVILEHFAVNSEEKALSAYGMMLWGNMNHEYNEASMGYSSNLSYVIAKHRGWSTSNLVGYMESHDEERLMYKNLKYGNSNGDYSVKNIDTALDRMELNGVFFFTLPGPKMIWEFGELGYDYSINRCEDGTISDDCRLSPKPVRWDYQDMQNRKDLFNIWSKLIYLKKNYDVFNTADFTYDLGSYQKSIHLNNPDMNITIIGNFDIKNSVINPAFQHKGWWYDYFENDSLNIVNTTDMITLKPGEYHLYSDKKMDGFITSSTDESFSQNNLIIYPNPASDYINIIINDNKTKKLTIIITDIGGRIVSKSKINIKAGFDHLKINTNKMQKGFYLIKIQELNIIEKMILD